MIFQGGNMVFLTNGFLGVFLSHLELTASSESWMAAICDKLGILIILIIEGFLDSIVTFSLQLLDQSH
jgi:hypothetical protein